MYDELKLKFLLNQKVEKYNNDQKTLHFNRYILKIVQIVILLIIIGILGTFAFSLTTPYFLKTEFLSDAVAIMFSSCLISLIVGGFVLFLFLKKIKSSRQNTPIKIHSYESTEPADSPDVTEALPESIDMPAKVPVKNMMPAVEKKTFLGRLVSVFSLSKELFFIFFGDLATLSNPPAKIYFDTNKINFAIWLLNEIEKHKNYCMSMNFVEENYKDVSSRWVTITISELEKINIIRAIKDDNNRDIVLLNLDFYDPENPD